MSPSRTCPGLVCARPAQRATKATSSINALIAGPPNTTARKLRQFCNLQWLYRDFGFCTRVAAPPTPGRVVFTTLLLKPKNLRHGDENLKKSQWLGLALASDMRHVSAPRDRRRSAMTHVL